MNKVRHLSIIAFTAAAWLVPSELLRADTPPPAVVAKPAQASIAFANNGGIWNWQVVDERTVLIQDSGRRWYKATLFAKCFNLGFAQRLGFESNPSGSFDKFSAIQVGPQRCPLTSLVRTTAPPKKLKPKAPVTTDLPVPSKSLTTP